MGSTPTSSTIKIPSRSFERLLFFMVEMKPVKALLHAPQGALHTAQPCFIFCVIAAKCFINPPLRRLCRKVYGLLRTFTDSYRQDGHKEICLYLSVAKHNGYFSAYFVDRVDQLDQMDSKKSSCPYCPFGPSGP